MNDKCWSKKRRAVALAGALIAMVSLARASGCLQEIPVAKYQAMLAEQRSNDNTNVRNRRVEIGGYIVEIIGAGGELALYDPKHTESPVRKVQVDRHSMQAVNIVKLGPNLAYIESLVDFDEVISVGFDMGGPTIVAHKFPPLLRERECTSWLYLLDSCESIQLKRARHIPGLNSLFWGAAKEMQNKGFLLDALLPRQSAPPYKAFIIGAEGIKASRLLANLYPIVIGEVDPSSKSGFKGAIMKPIEDGKRDVIQDGDLGYFDGKDLVSMRQKLPDVMKNRLPHDSWWISSSGRLFVTGIKTGLDRQILEVLPDYSTVERLRIPGTGQLSQYFEIKDVAVLIKSSGAISALDLRSNRAQKLINLSSENTVRFSENSNGETYLALLRRGDVEKTYRVTWRQGLEICK